MIQRVVLFQLQPGADQEEFVEAVSALALLDQVIPQITSWWLSVDPGREGQWDAALIASFDDEASMKAYEDHPEHVRVATRIGGVSNFAIYDTEI